MHFCITRLASETQYPDCYFISCRTCFVFCRLSTLYLRSITLHVGRSVHLSACVSGPVHFSPLIPFRQYRFRTRLGWIFSLQFCNFGNKFRIWTFFTNQEYHKSFDLHWNVHSYLKQAELCTTTLNGRCDSLTVSDAMQSLSDLIKPFVFGLMWHCPTTNYNRKIHFYTHNTDKK